MGGLGSGRRPSFDKKTVVEDCRVLDLGALLRDGRVVPGQLAFGSLHWTNAHTNEERGSVSFVSGGGPDGAFLRLRYRLVNREGDVDERLQLVSTPCHWGGFRWWFTCPLEAHGRPCGRRVGKLYLPPGRRLFGCRHCYNLTYTSVQEHDKRVDFYRRNPEAALEALGSMVNGSYTAADSAAIRAILSRRPSA